ncbi:MAG: amino acid permease, partial [Candidatus Omnitrophota bacterium]
KLLENTLTPISDAAVFLGGSFLKSVISIGAFLAFVTTANAGIMTASRYPLGMSRDKLLPVIFQRISPKSKTPYISILFTGFFMIIVVTFLKLELLVKVASSILIMLYIFANLTLILFRESKILSYNPKFRSPFYPYIQILGILGGLFLLIEMGTFIIFLTTIFLLLGIGWYKIYVQKRTTKDSALIYVLERLVAKDKEFASENLLTELKDIVIKRDDLIEDKFHKLIEESRVLDIDIPLEMNDLFKEVSNFLSRDLNMGANEIFEKLVQREKDSSTLIRPGLAIPHIIIEGKDVFKIILVRARAGVIFPENKVAHIVFILAGSSDVRNLHLKALAAIAQITQNPEFDKKWLSVANKDELKNIILLAERRRG